MEHDVTDFEVEVIERSREKPILVDFWAPWCGPCKVIGPVLEKLASEAAGSWALAKLNTDDHPTISMQFGIRGIPAVKLFIDGVVEAEFMGALPEYAVKKWLDENLPSEDRVSVAQAADLARTGHIDEAVELLETLDGDEAKILLAGLVVFGEPARASQLVAGVDASTNEARLTIDAIRTVTGVLQTDDSGLPEGSGKSNFAGAVSDIRSGQFDKAAKNLIAVLQNDREYGDDSARKLGIALFTLLGPEDSATKANRRTFDMHLF